MVFWVVLIMLRHVALYQHGKKPGGRIDSNDPQVLGVQCTASGMGGGEHERGRGGNGLGVQRPWSCTGRLIFLGGALIVAPCCQITMPSACACRLGASCAGLLGYWRMRLRERARGSGVLEGKASVRI